MASRENRIPHHAVYVIRLDESVWQLPRFRRQNPRRVQGKPCVYVGMTGIGIEARFGQHRSGKRANRYARDYGRYLVRRRCLTGLTFEEARREEVRVAEALRRRGWGVWQA